MTNTPLNNGKDLPNKIAFRAAWVYPVAQPEFKDGIVAVENGEIQFVGRLDEFDLTQFHVEDLGDGAIIPGLVNAHTHLEFSDLATPLGHAGIKFTDWIRAIVKSRIESNEAPSEKKRLAIQSGIKESLEAGVVGIGEIATMPFAWEDYKGLGLDGCLVFLEQLGSDESFLGDKRNELNQFLDSQTESNFVFGASPHAPYSCHEKLVDQICELAIQKSRIVAMHLAETLPERELLATQTGDFVELLKDFGVWNPENFPTDSRHIYSTLEQLSKTKSLIIHGNYLNDIELDFIANHPEMTIVFCPRTHQYFGHSQYPLNKMRQRSIPVAVGTDSRASNPDLDLFKELKLIASSFPELTTNEILKMGTLNGAEALVMKELGSLSIGKRGVFNFVKQPSDRTSSPDEWLFEPESICRRVV